MEGKPESEPKKINPFSDVLFIVFFVGMLAAALGGSRVDSVSGWPELLLGGLAFLCMILMLVRVFRLKKRAQR